MIDQLRHATAVIEAERTLARLAQMERATTRVLRKRLNDLLGKLTAVVRDGELWDRLADAAVETPAAEELDAMIDFATFDLAPLLEAFGYHCPPEPSARAMVDRTVSALLAARADEDGDRRQRIEDARLDLLTFALRVRRQVESTPLFAGPGVLREMITITCARARDLSLALVATGSAGAVAEQVEDELGVFLSKSLEKLVELSVRPVAVLVAGLGILWRVTERNEHLDPITLHLTALFAGVNSLRSSGGDETTDPWTHAQGLRYHLEKQRQAGPAVDSALDDLDTAFFALAEADQDACDQAVQDLEAAAWRLHGVLDRVSQDQLVSNWGKVSRQLKGWWNKVRPGRRRRSPSGLAPATPPTALEKLRSQVQDERRRRNEVSGPKTEPTPHEIQGPSAPA